MIPKPDTSIAKVDMSVGAVDMSVDDEDASVEGVVSSVDEFAEPSVDGEFVVVQMDSHIPQSALFKKIIHIKLIVWVWLVPYAQCCKDKKELLPTSMSLSK